MANIPVYDQPSLGLQPTEIGAESFAAAGRRGGAFFNQAGESIANAGARAGRALATVGDVAVNYMDHQQINAGAEHGANLFANLTDSWNQTAAGSDPHDPSVAKKFREEVLEPALTQFQDGFSTEKSQEWAAHFTNTMRQHFFEKSEADMSRMAADAVTSTMTTMQNRFSNVAINDPTAVPAMLSQIDHSIEGVLGANPNIKGPDAARVRTEAALKLKESVVKAGAFGAILNSGDPERAATEWSKRYPDFVSGTESLTLAKSARTALRINESEARNARVTQDYINKQNFNDAANKLEVSTIPTNAGDPPVLPKDYWDTVRKIATMPGVEPSRLRALVENGEHITAKLGKPEPLAPISHETTMNLLDGIRTGKVTSTDDIYKAYGDNKLNNADFHFLQNEFAQRKTPEGERLDKDRETFFKRFAAQFDPYFGQDPKYAGNLYVAEMDARRKEVEVQKAGGDPHSVYDPNSPNFFGKDTSKYKAPLQQLLQRPQAAPETPKPQFTPPANWQFSPSRKQYRDPNGKLYDINGKPVS